jgi:hypothetical protein
MWGSGSLARALSVISGIVGMALNGVVVRTPLSVGDFWPSLPHDARVDVQANA